MRFSGLMAGVALCLEAPSVVADSVVLSRHWQSVECGIELRLVSNGWATFTWNATPMEATWRRKGERLILDIKDDLHEFDGNFALDDRLEGIHSWADVAGMIGERSCVLTPKP